MSCIFCNIYHNQTQQILYKDSKVFAFHDISKASFTQHILVCPIQHTASALEITDPNLILHMQKVGIEVLDKLNNGKEYKFGFHLGWTITVGHTHLHGFVLPYNSWFKGRVIYGYLLNSVESIVEKIKQKDKKKGKAVKA